MALTVSVGMRVEYIEEPLLDNAGRRVGTRFIGRIEGAQHPPVELAVVRHPPDQEPEELRLLREHTAKLAKQIATAS